MSTARTKFEITIAVEIEDAGGLEANASTLTDKISKAIENLPGSYNKRLDIKDIHISRTGRVTVNITPKVIKSQDTGEEEDYYSFYKAKK